MKRKVLLLLLAAGLLALAACAPSYESGYYYGRPEPIGYGGLAVPPSYYDYDPTMQQWYTPPYFDPYATQ